MKRFSLEEKLNSLYNKWCRSSKKINADTIKLLEYYQPSQARINFLREKFEIPHLSPEDDQIAGSVVIGHKDYGDDGRSEWFESLSKTEQRKLEKEIDQILQEFNLPQTFEWREWLLYYILYKDKTWYTPAYNFDFLTLCEGARLTTGEKKEAERRVKILETELENNKQLLRLFHKANKEILKSKNKLRPLRNIDRDIEIITRGKGYYEETDEETGKTVRKRETDRDIVVEIWPDEFGGENKRAQIIRKARERFKKVQAQRFERKK